MKIRKRQHPDPSIELQLQAILDMRRAIGRYERQIAVYRSEFVEYGDMAREDSKPERVKLFLARQHALHTMTFEVEERITGVYAQIEAASSKLDPSDLAYLAGRLQ